MPSATASKRVRKTGSKLDDLKKQQAPQEFGRVKPYGRKAMRFITRHPDQDAMLNILNGAVRSSKTWAVNAKLLYWLGEGWWPGGTGMITGVSKTSIKTNVLNDLFNLCDAGGKKRYHYNSSSGELMLLGRPFRVVGAKDEGSYKTIKGSTVGIWIGDELTEIPQSFFEMAVSRLSLPGSRMWGTTNPSNPHHYLKKEWLEDEAKVLNRDVWSQTWTLDDNPNLLDSKKDQLKRSFAGVFYLRNILGLWVVAEGAIYRDSLTDDNFYTDATRPIGLLHPGGHRQRLVSVDYGTINPCVFIDGYDDGNVIWADREYYFDSRERMFQKTDAQYADDMVIFVNGGDPSNPIDRINKRQTEDRRLWPGIVVDPSAASFKTELMKRGFIVYDANNEVEEGISLVSAMLNQKKLKINEQRCPEGKREMQTYAWDEKKAEGGREQPIKEHDHYPDSLRYRCCGWFDRWRLAA